MDKIITTDEAKKRIGQGKDVYAILKRKYDTGTYYGKDMLNVEDIPNTEHFYIKENVFYGAGLLERKIKNYHFIIIRR